MNITFEKSLPSGTLVCPPSKSYAHRALICGAFSKKSIIRNLSFSEDIKATVSCLKVLGANVEYKDNTVIIGGLDKSNIKDGLVLDCNESGSTLRFFIPICLTFGKKIVLKGSKRLLERPLDEYKKLCENNGFLFETNSDCVIVCGNLKNGEYIINSEVSSQFVTGMLLALSTIGGKSILKLSGNTESKPYINMTVDTLNRFGIKTENADNQIGISGLNETKSIDYTVEGDCSNGAYIECFNFINGSVNVEGINPKTIQGDYVYKKMFADIQNGIKSFDLKDCPDLGPIMFAVSCLFGGAEFKGTKRLKYKECDRSMAMKEELEKFGVKVYVSNDSVLINSVNIHKPNVPILSHNDHRIVMALSLLCAKYGGTISGAEAVNKSYPDFFSEISKIKVRFKQNDA